MSANVRQRRLLQVAREDTDDRLVGSIQHAIERHATDPKVSVAVVAVTLRRSPSWLSHHLQDTDADFWSRVHAARVGHAQALLQMTDLAVKAVGLAVGYNHPQDFCHWFRQLTGVTPGAWRRSRRG